MQNKSVNNNSFIVTNDGKLVISSSRTMATLELAYKVVNSIAKNDGKFLFVGTDSFSREVVKFNAERTGNYYINYKWVPGFLTERKKINGLIGNLRRLEQLAANNFQGYDTSKKAIAIDELRKLRAAFGGVLEMTDPPHAIIIANAEKEVEAIREARLLSIPTIGIEISERKDLTVTVNVSSNDNIPKITDLIITLLSDAIASGIGLKTITHLEEKEAAELGIVKEKEPPRLTTKEIEIEQLEEKANKKKQEVDDILNKLVEVREEFSAVKKRKIQRKNTWSLINAEFIKHEIDEINGETAFGKEQSVIVVEEDKDSKNYTSASNGQAHSFNGLDSDFFNDLDNIERDKINSQRSFNVAGKKYESRISTDSRTGDLPPILKFDVDRTNPFNKSLGNYQKEFGHLGKDPLDAINDWNDEPIVEVSHFDNPETNETELNAALFEETTAFNQNPPLSDVETIRDLTQELKLDLSDLQKNENEKHLPKDEIDELLRYELMKRDNGRHNKKLVRKVLSSKDTVLKEQLLKQLLIEDSKLPPSMGEQLASPFHESEKEVVKHKSRAEIELEELKKSLFRELSEAGEEEKMKKSRLSKEEIIRKLIKESSGSGMLEESNGSDLLSRYSQHSHSSSENDLLQELLNKRREREGLTPEVSKETLKADILRELLEEQKKETQMKIQQEEAAKEAMKNQLLQDLRAKREQEELKAALLEEIKLEQQKEEELKWTAGRNKEATKELIQAELLREILEDGIGSSKKKSRRSKKAEKKNQREGDTREQLKSLLLGDIENRKESLRNTLDNASSVSNNSFSRSDLLESILNQRESTAETNFGNLLKKETNDEATIELSASELKKLLAEAKAPKPKPVPKKEKTVEISADLLKELIAQTKPKKVEKKEQDATVELSADLLKELLQKPEVKEESNDDGYVVYENNTPSKELSIDNVLDTLASEAIMQEEVKKEKKSKKLSKRKTKKIINELKEETKELRDLIRSDDGQFETMEQKLNLDLYNEENRPENFRDLLKEKLKLEMVAKLKAKEEKEKEAILNEIKEKQKEEDILDAFIRNDGDAKEKLLSDLMKEVKDELGIDERPIEEILQEAASLHQEPKKDPYDTKNIIKQLSETEEKLRKLSMEQIDLAKKEREKFYDQSKIIDDVSLQLHQVKNTKTYRSPDSKHLDNRLSKLKDEFKRDFAASYVPNDSPIRRRVNLDVNKPMIVKSSDEKKKLESKILESESKIEEAKHRLLNYQIELGRKEELINKQKFLIRRKRSELFQIEKDIANLKNKIDVKMKENLRSTMYARELQSEIEEGKMKLSMIQREIDSKKRRAQKLKKEGEALIYQAKFDLKDEHGEAKLRAIRGGSYSKGH